MTKQQTSSTKTQTTTTTPMIDPARELAVLGDMLVMTARSDYQRAARQLADKMEQVVRSLTHKAAEIREALEAGEETGGLVNPLGEIQGSASEIDRLCAVLSERCDKLSSAKYLAEKLNANLTAITEQHAAERASFDRAAAAEAAVAIRNAEDARNGEDQ